MILLVSIVTFFVSFVILWISRKYLAGNGFHSGDTFFHLLISESIRNNKWKYPTSLQNVTFDEADEKYKYLRYPPLFHYFVALFPVKFHLKAAKFLNLILLSFLGSLTAYFSFALTENVYIAIISSFITVFSMAIFELQVMFTPRPLGLLFYSLIACLAIFYPQTLFTILITPLLVAAIILTHKFATQILIFSLIPYALIFNKPILILGFGLGVLLAIIMSKGVVLKIFKEHISWLYFYSRFPSRASYFLKLRDIFVRNTWYIAVIAGLAIVFYKNSTLVSAQTTGNIIFWTFIPLVVALLVSIPNLSFLGENYRYIEYSVVPLGILSSILLASLNLFILFAFSVCLVMPILILNRYKTHLYKRKDLVNSDDILSYRLLSNYNLGNLLVFPHTRSLEVNYFTRLKVVHPVRTKETMTDSQILNSILSKYEIGHVLRFKNKDSNEKFEALTSIVNVKLISDFGYFELYELNKSKT